jgi:hypothetical protein
LMLRPATFLLLLVPIINNITLFTFAYTILHCVLLTNV